MNFGDICSAIGDGIKVAAGSTIATVAANSVAASVGAAIMHGAGYKAHVVSEAVKAATKGGALVGSFGGFLLGFFDQSDKNKNENTEIDSINYRNLEMHPTEEENISWLEKHSNLLMTSLFLLTSQLAGGIIGKVINTGDPSFEELLNLTCDILIGDGVVVSGTLLVYIVLSTLAQNCRLQSKREEKIPLFNR